MEHTKKLGRAPTGHRCHLLLLTPPSQQGVPERLHEEWCLQGGEGRPPGQKVLYRVLLLYLQKRSRAGGSEFGRKACSRARLSRAARQGRTGQG
jgi:hypothetical protein